MKRHLLSFIVLALAAIASLVSGACGPECEVGSGHVGAIRLGLPKDEVRTLLARRYSVVDRPTPGRPDAIAAQVRGRANQSAFVVAFNAGRVVRIDSYERCGTASGIGPGVMLGKAQEVYGAGRLEPTDLGYFLRFPPNDELAFLLDDRDIPQNLRRIPGDVFSAANERDILRLANVRILAVRVEAR